MHFRLEPHPQLALVAFTTTLPGNLATLVSPPWLRTLLRLEAAAPVQRSETVRAAVRDLLRQGGYKPTGRGKPAAEFLLREASTSGLRSINPAVDAGNAVSLHSGLPISVVDQEQLVLPLHVGLATAGARFVFNEAGQEIDVEGLLCLHDASGPCANAVKDAQRTKTHGATRCTLNLVWGAQAVRTELERAAAWYRELLARLDAATAPVRFEPSD